MHFVQHPRFRIKCVIYLPQGIYLPFPDHHEPSSHRRFWIRNLGTGAAMAPCFLMPSLVEQIDARSSVAVLSTTARLLVEAKFEPGTLIYRHHIGVLGRNMQARKSWNYYINSPGF